MKFGDFYAFYQTFVSPQVKQSPILTYKPAPLLVINTVYTHRKLPNDLRLKI